VPSGPLPDQPRPGDPDPKLDRGSGRSLGELIEAYRRRLEGTITPWIGTPYLWGGSTRGVGTDCSGFTRGVFQEGFAVDLPRVARDQFRVGRSVSVDQLRPGDLVFFDTADAGRVTHVGVFQGDGRFAQAASKGVSYAKLDERYYRRAYRGARRLLVYPE
jgi:cell wall-associated NlpC family hydrolase